MHKYLRETEKTLFYRFVLSKDLHHALEYLYLKFLDIPRGVLEAYYEVRFLKYHPLFKKFDYITWKSYDTVEAQLGFIPACQRLTQLQVFHVYAIPDLHIKSKFPENHGGPFWNRELLWHTV